ncbi:unnamed protein product [Urochloa decumbens]|uniref:F-box domain-containing protein n=1 Tax=Urochloa decumbens TaxID=240449 RepID=A0ABC8W9W8_9POAL
MRLRSGRLVGSDEKRRRTLATAIPDDLLIYEVLIHLPAKSLARCRCVCRFWRAAIAGAAFVHRHLQLSRARPPSSMLSIPREIDAAGDDCATSSEISFHRLPLLLPPAHAHAQPPPGASAITDTEFIFEKAWSDGITRHIIPTHCDGLVAIATATDTVFVCNPATREFVVLPPGTHNELAELLRLHSGVPVLPVALGFDQWRNRYVIARYFYKKDGEASFNEATGEWSQHCYVGHEVFTLGGGGSWEVTEYPPQAAGIQSRPRAFAVVPRPPTGWNRAGDDMADLDGKLCYVHADGEAATFRVWLADDEHDGPHELRWSLRFCIKFLYLPDDPDPDVIHHMRPVISVGDKVLSAATGKYYPCLLWAATMSDEEQEAVHFHHGLQYQRPDGSKYMAQSEDFMHHVLPYFESLVSLTSYNY